MPGAWSGKTPESRTSPAIQSNRGLELAAQHLFHVLHLAGKPAGGALLVIDDDAGFHPARHGAHGLMAVPKRVPYHRRLTLYQGAHGGELVIEPALVDQVQDLGDIFLHARPMIQRDDGE